MRYGHYSARFLRPEPSIRLTTPNFSLVDARQAGTTRIAVLQRRGMLVHWIYATVFASLTTSVPITLLHCFHSRVPLDFTPAYGSTPMSTRTYATVSWKTRIISFEQHAPPLLECDHPSTITGTVLRPLLGDVAHYYTRCGRVYTESIPLRFFPAFAESASHYGSEFSFGHVFHYSGLQELLHARLRAFSRCHLVMVWTRSKGLAANAGTPFVGSM
jgi:hypothetical protein